MNQKSLRDSITEALKPGIWFNRMDHWYLENDQFIFIIYLQKSEFGGKFYVNIGVFIRPGIVVENQFVCERLSERYDYMKRYYDYKKEYSLGKYPRERHCDIRVRLDRLVPDRDGFIRALDLEDPSTKDQQRLITVSQAIKNYAVPVFSGLDGIESLRAYYRDHILRNPQWFIPLKVKELLEGVLTQPEQPWRPKPGQVVF